MAPPGSRQLGGGEVPHRERAVQPARHERWRSSGVTAREVTPSPGASRVRRSTPETVSHSRIVSSQLPLTTWWSLERKATHETSPSCPRSTAVALSFSGSQRRSRLVLSAGRQESAVWRVGQGCHMVLVPLQKLGRHTVAERAGRQPFADPGYMPLVPPPGGTPRSPLCHRGRRCHSPAPKSGRTKPATCPRWHRLAFVRWERRAGLRATALTCPFTICGVNAGTSPAHHTFSPPSAPHPIRNCPSGLRARVSGRKSSVSARRLIPGASIPEPDGPPGQEPDPSQADNTPAARSNEHLADTPHVAAHTDYIDLEPKALFWQPKVGQSEAPVPCGEAVVGLPLTRIRPSWLNARLLTAAPWPHIWPVCLPVSVSHK